MGLLRHFIGLACLLGAAAAAHGQAVQEYQPKAVFLFNFARFTEWPADVFAGPDAPVVLCVAGERWVHGEIASAVHGKMVDRRPLRVERFGETAACHLLFVAGMEPAAGPLRARNDFTVAVGEHERFLAAGGHINFYIEGSAIRFDIALKAVERGRFRLSSKLLSLAKPQKS
jgi:hypothetical protein